MPGSPYLDQKRKVTFSTQDEDYTKSGRYPEEANTAPTLPAPSNSGSNPTKNCSDEKRVLLKDESSSAPSFRRLWLSMVVTLACYNIACMATIPWTAQYLTHRVSHDWYNFTNLSRHIPCTKDVNTSATRTRDEIQKAVSSLSLLINYASSLPAILTCLFYGVLSDHVGRKTVMLIPLFGGFVRVFVYFLVVELDLSLNFLFLGSAVDGLCGSYQAVSMVTAAAVADITRSSGGRAISFAAIECVLIMSSAIANLSVGYFIMYEGYLYPTIMMSGLTFIALIVAATAFPETNITRVKASPNPLKHFKKVVSFYTFAGTSRRRALFRLGFFMFFLNIVVSLGRSTVETLYQLNSPFCWDSVKIGIFGSIQSSVQIICSVLALRVLRQRLNLETIGILALLCAIAGFVIEGFAVEDWMLYIVPAVGLIIYTITPITRALMSRMAASSDQGALFASLSVVDAICGILSFTTYNSVYLSTVQWFRGTVFFVMAGVCALNITLFLAFKTVNSNYDYNEITCDIEPSTPSNHHEKDGLSSQNKELPNAVD